MTDASVKERDYFRDRSVLLDPYQYFDEMRAGGPFRQLTTHDALLCTGYQECIEILNNHKDFSSLNALASSAFPLPFTPEGDDISDQLEAHRDQFAGGSLVVCYDDDRHTKVRSLISKFFTPVRLKANHDFMVKYADQLVQQAAAKGEAECMSDLASAFVTMVIADLLGVPDEDRDKFRDIIDSAEPPGSIDNADHSVDPAEQALAEIGMHFFGYFQERMDEPKEDLMSELAQSSYPDGSKPDLIELVSLATFMFGAGQDTSAKLIGNAMRYIVDEPGLQEKLREDRSLVPGFVEEMLRIEGSTKATHRVARRDTEVCGQTIPMGTRVIVALAAANRDPRRWEDPAQFKLGRERAREHIAFGRGLHTCAGAALARAEVVVFLNSLFDHTANIAISEAKHGKKGERHFDFEPTFIIRGLDNLHLELTPA
jgi:cytochrome P450